MPDAPQAHTRRVPNQRRVVTRPFRVGLIGLLVVACGAPPVISPSNPLTSPPPPTDSASATNASVAPSIGPLFDEVLAGAIAHVGQPIGDLDVDVDRERLLTAMGLATSLGADAERILGLVATTEAGARSLQSVPTTLPWAPTSLDNGAFVDAKFLVAAFKRIPTLESEFKQYLAGGVDAIGFDGPNPFHSDLGTTTFRQTDGTLSSTSQMHMTADVVFAGSDVKATFATDIQTSVTDTVSGTTVLTETSKHLTTGQLDACPNAAGSVPGSIDISVDEDASTFAGAGVTTSHATGHSTRSSQFMGTTDDQANLGSISQTYTEDKQFKRTATGADGQETTSEGAYTVGVSGINDGVARERGIGATIGDWSGAERAEDQISGGMTPDMIHGIDTNAGYDFATIEAGYLQAQKLIRDSRCVIVTAPTYIPRSAFDRNARPTHSEDVEKGSTTVFQVGVDHRFGQSVSAKITVEFDGKESISPDVVERPPGALTYVAPGEDGKDAHVMLTSTSRQGIGRLKLTFHTGTKKLKVSIDGTMTTTGFGVTYKTTLHVKDVILTMTSETPKLSSDKATKLVPYAGSGPATAEVLIGISDCPKPYKQNGTMKLRAEHDVALDDSYEGKWLITFDPSTTFDFHGGSCVGVPLESFVGSGDAGPIAGFMFVLGTVPISKDATGAHIKLTRTLGATTNVIDVNVEAVVVSESGP